MLLVSQGLYGSSVSRRSMCEIFLSYNIEGSVLIGLIQHPAGFLMFHAGKADVSVDVFFVR